MSKSNILVVGSLAYDTITSPEGHADKVLGGSANYFSLVASLMAPVRVVGIVGEDYQERHVELLRSRGVDLTGMERAPGKTFHWEGEYGKDMNNAKSLATHLNVFEHFNPKLPESYKDSEYVFLANIDPELQIRVLDQVKSPKFVAMDTMNFWIESKYDVLKTAISRVDALLINEGEATLLSRKPNAVAAALEISKMGPKAVVIKRGEYGFVLYAENQFFALPAMPVARVVDPTGAGDTFAGGFFGFLAKNKLGHSLTDLKRACVHGCVVASYTVQDFGTHGVRELTNEKLQERHQEFMKVIAYPGAF